MDFNENFQKFIKKVNGLSGQFDEFAEEQTKNALVMPFFNMLGYDVFDTNEFMPEYTCDVATKKGEKVDYAILRDGDPIMIIEVKRAGMKLQKQQQGQLFRYFSTNRCRVAILTNGITYQFFSDLNEANIMDNDPFFSFNLIEDDERIYTSVLKQFCKGEFNTKEIISKAIYQKYSRVVEKTLEQDLINPSDEIIKYFLSRPEIKTGSKITSKMIEKHRDITREAMQRVFGIIINENLNINPNISDNADVNKTASDEITKDDSIQVDNVNNSDKKDTDTLINPILTNEDAPIDINVISQKIQDDLQKEIADCSCREEDNDNSIKLHIYTSNNCKLGIVKISKDDRSVQCKKIGVSQYSTVVNCNDIIDLLNG